MLPHQAHGPLGVSIQLHEDEHAPLAAVEDDVLPCSHAPGFEQAMCDQSPIVKQLLPSKCSITPISQHGYLSAIFNVAA